MKTVFLRVLDVDDKATALLDAVREPERARGRQRFEVDPTSFASVAGSPFAYWVSDRMRRVFADVTPFESGGRFARNGLKTDDDFRFVRCIWELRPELRANGAWPPIVKGGRRSPFYADVPMAINWSAKGLQLKALAIGRYGNAGKRIFNEEHYLKPGLTWPLRGIRFSASAVPARCIFSVGGKMAFAPKSELSCLMAAFNSSAFDALLCLFAGKVGGVQYESGLIARVPLALHCGSVGELLAALAVQAWSLRRFLDTRTEASHAFALPALLQVVGCDVAARAAARSEQVRTVEATLVTIESSIDERCFALYGIDEADRRTITEGFGGNAAEAESSAADDEAGEDGEEGDSAADAASLAAELVSWAVGVAFGRFDVRLATGARPMPTEPEPFDPLPACSPGMLTGGDGLPLAQPPAGYPLAFPEAGVLVDDLGHAQDLPTAVRAVFEAVFGADADRWWSDVAALLDPKGHDLRVWLAGSFFEHHLQRHSKSRRKAPILWQLGTPSGRYSVWLYAHRLTRDSFFLLQNEVVGPKLTHAEQQLTSLIQNAGDNPSVLERKEIAAQEAVVEELRAMLEEVKRVAPLWHPNLDDGVVLTMAPLWRLVPQCKPWQKELKANWDEISAGKYDWAHLAMHLWPERVVPKCATDRSAAIAHGLESEFWVQSDGGRWKSRTTPLKSVRELVRDRSSPALKAALKSMLDAPTASGNGRARVRRAATPAASEGGSR